MQIQSGRPVPLIYSKIIYWNAAVYSCPDLAAFVKDMDYLSELLADGELKSYSYRYWCNQQSTVVNKCRLFYCAQAPGSVGRKIPDAQPLEWGGRTESTEEGISQEQSQHSLSNSLFILFTITRKKQTFNLLDLSSCWPGRSGTSTTCSRWTHTCTPPPAWTTSTSSGQVSMPSTI